MYAFSGFGDLSLTANAFYDPSYDDADGATDCDDADCAAFASCLPQTETVCNDGLDDDGDGSLDCADSDCSGVPVCTAEVCDDDVDNDADGAIDCADSDCTSANGCIAEYCSNGEDDNGDGKVDCADARCVHEPVCKTCRGTLVRGMLDASKSIERFEPDGRLSASTSPTPSTRTAAATASGCATTPAWPLRCRRGPSISAVIRA